MFPSFEQYQEFQLLNLENPGTQEQYDSAKGNVNTIQGWVVGVNLEHDIPAKKKKYGNFEDYFKPESTYAAIFYAEKNLKVVVFIPWKGESVAYCPPNKDGKPQDLEEPKKTGGKGGYLSFFNPDTKVIYTNEATKKWEESSIKELNENLQQGRPLGVTISSTCVNAPIIRVTP